MGASDTGCSKTLLGSIAEVRGKAFEIQNFLVASFEQLAEPKPQEGGKPQLVNPLDFAIEELTDIRIHLNEIMEFLQSKVVAKVK